MKWAPVLFVWYVRNSLKVSLAYPSPVYVFFPPAQLSCIQGNLLLNGPDISCHFLPH